MVECWCGADRRETSSSRKNRHDRDVSERKPRDSSVLPSNVVPTRNVV